VTFSGTQGEVRGCIQQRSSIHYSKNAKTPIASRGQGKFNLTSQTAIQQDLSAGKYIYVVQAGLICPKILGLNLSYKISVRRPQKTLKLQTYYTIPM
jgi:hypothetical protein